LVFAKAEYMRYVEFGQGRVAFFPVARYMTVITINIGRRIPVPKCELRRWECK